MRYSNTVERGLIARIARCNLIPMSWFWSSAVRGLWDRRRFLSATANRDRAVYQKCWSLSSCLCPLNRNLKKIWGGWRSLVGMKLALRVNYCFFGISPVHLLSGVTERGICRRVSCDVSYDDEYSMRCLAKFRGFVFILCFFFLKGLC